MPRSTQGLQLLRFSEIIYLALTTLSFYFLFMSRSREASTVWQVLHPAFIPVIFAASFLLFMILLTSEKTAYKLLFVIILSILVHSLFSIVFPVGDLSGQQSILGRVRLVFDNTVLHGLTGWPNQSIQVFIYQLFTGTNLQAALSVIFARMLSIDILYVHLFFIPVLWGTFTPIGVFLVTRAIGGSEKGSVLSSLLISAFPYATYFGAISVPNSLGFIFFLYSLYFMLRHLSSSDSTTLYWILIFSFFSVLSHYLTGFMSLSLLVLTLAFKTFQREKNNSPSNAKILLLVSFLICVSLIPLSFIYLRVFSPGTNVVFTLDKFSELPPQDVIKLAFLGPLIYGFRNEIIFLVIIGPTIAFLCMIYLVYHERRRPAAKTRMQIQFLFTAFLIVLIDYGLMKVFMEGVPINEERLWVFRDLIAAPFVGLTAFAVVTSLEGFLRAKFPNVGLPHLRKSFTSRIIRASSLLLISSALVSALLGGWITLSLSAAYPQVAPLQITWYELEAVKYIDQVTHEKYVVIGDLWTIYTGQVIVGETNPRAYYFGASDKSGHELFVNMSRDPSPQWMLNAMNKTQTAVAYFIVTESRLGAEEFQNVVSRSLQNEQLTPVDISSIPSERLRVFSYRKGGT